MGLIAYSAQLKSELLAATGIAWTLQHLLKAGVHLHWGLKRHVKRLPVTTAADSG